MTHFLVDSNTFIQAKNFHYGFDICAGFWRSLDVNHGKERIFSIDRVKTELLEGNDELKDWAKDKSRTSFFEPTDDIEVIEKTAEILDWLQDQDQYKEAGKADFSAKADPWLIAYAYVHGLTIVTHEQLRLETKKRVPIPNVCDEFDVDYTDVFEMLRTLKTRMVMLGKRKP